MLRNLIVILFVLFNSSFIGCASSEKYHGSWKALDINGNKYEITFTEETLVLMDSLGNMRTMDYKQHSVLTQNSSRSYGIEVRDGMSFSVILPTSNMVEKGAITDQNNKVIFTLGKSRYYNYDEIFGL